MSDLTQFNRTITNPKTDDEKINEINNSDELKFRGSKSVKPINN